MKKRFLIYGHGGCYNHGGEALIRCGIEVLREKFPGCYIILSSHFPEQDREFCLPADEIVGCDRSYLSADHTSANSAEDFYKLYHSTIEKITPETICIHLGGDNYCYPNWRRYSYIHYQAIERGAKSILWSCSIDPNLMDTEMLKALRTHHLITAREGVTYRALVQHRLSQVEKVSDMAFRLIPEPVPLDVANYVSITFGPLAAKCETKPGLALNSFQRLIDYILASTDMNIVLVPHVIMPSDNDCEMMSRLRINDGNRVWLITDHYSAAQLKFVIANARYCVTLRTHASIAAYSSCVPTLVVGYSMKSIGIAEDLGCSEYVLQMQDISDEYDITNAFKKLIQNELGQRRQLNTVIPEYIRNTISEKALAF